MSLGRIETELERQILQPKEVVSEQRILSPSFSFSKHAVKDTKGCKVIAMFGTVGENSGTMDTMHHFHFEKKRESFPNITYSILSSWPWGEPLRLGCLQPHGRTESPTGHSKLFTSLSFSPHCTTQL